ncbi:sensor histidine kinase [Lacisediminihabitans changchengi]|uniref:Oxygen sensor histidine kinase NreB n=1 Tax=Lacisediminihabitans changchengi TaxID=2787634 RepID=A0A934SPX3_9MICO|nr:sensor histidine kinase [Lacisediminihabitans changchengi]MBK4349077.1 sensor histidine kinase [Lacisediminihabitans changchengi]
MTGARWWNVLVVGTILVLAAINGVTRPFGPWQQMTAWIALALFLACYVLYGRRALRDGTSGIAFSATVIVLSGVVVACSPSLAVIQAIAFPLVWVAIESTRLAIVANVALALVVSAGFLIVLGTDPQNIANTAVIEAISLVGSLALGTWITRIAELSAERKLLIDELTQTQDQLALLSRDAGVTSERERLAREIHDTIAQSLTGLVMLSQRAQRELAAGETGAVGDRLELIEESARETLVETRSLVASSAPVELGGGIAAALDRLGARFDRETGIRVSVSADISGEFDRDAEVVLLRCAQESLANVRKHSRARAVSIRLEGCATMTVTDDGVGFDPLLPNDGFGLVGMRDRLALVAGTLAVSSAPGTGTTLTVSLPAGVTP